MLVRASLLCLLAFSCSTQDGSEPAEQSGPLGEAAADDRNPSAEAAQRAETTGMSPSGAAPGASPLPVVPGMTDEQRRVDIAANALSPYRFPAGGINNFTFSDTNGTTYDALGRAKGGGPALTALPSYRQFWFAWVAFNPGSEVFAQTGTVQQPPIGKSEECFIDCDQIFEGGPPKDGIPALTAPEMVAASSEAAEYIHDRSYIVGFAPPEGSSEPARAYPHNLFWHHEIVNDEAFGTPVAVTHCPLTFSSLTYDPRSFNPGQEVELGVSGKLFQSNLVFYNRHDDTYFSQLLGVGVDGPLTAHRPELLPSYEMTWGAWRELFPDSVVASESTGHARNYENYPYGDYFTDNSNTWSTIVEDDRYPNKSVAYGLRLKDNAKVYPEEELRRHVLEARGEFAPPRGIINDTLGDQALVVVFDLEAGYFQVFEAAAEGDYTFSSTGPDSVANPTSEASGGASAAGCGPVFSCEPSQFCVETRGALCMPLPPAGQQCPAECTPTEHCCNCPAFACVDTPASCDGTAECGCIGEAPPLKYCGVERRECEGQGRGLDVTCINVDFDEDPFAEDPFAAAAAAE